MEEKKLIQLIPKLQTIEFIGLTKLLGVALVKDDIPLPFTEVLDNLLIKFRQQNQKKKKEILTLIEKTIKKRRQQDADNS